MAHPALERLGLRIWRRRRFVVFSTLAVLVTANIVAFLWPARYQSSALLLVAPRADSLVTGLAPASRSATGPAAIAAGRLDHLRLHRIVAELKLYPELVTHYPEEPVLRMRRDVGVRIAGPDVIRISYEARDPEVANAVATRLVALLVDEPSAMRATATGEFLDAQLEDARRQLADFERREARRTRPLGAVAARDYEALTESYRTLLAKREDFRLALAVESRSQPTFRVIDPPRVPDAPIPPPRMLLNGIGALAGFALGLIVAGWPPGRHAEDAAVDG